MRKKMTFREDQITDMILYMVGTIDSEKEPDEEKRIENLKQLLQIIDELIGEIAYAVDLYDLKQGSEDVALVYDWLVHKKDWIYETIGEVVE